MPKHQTYNNITLLFAVSEGECLVELIQQDLSSSASATSVAEMERVVKL